MTPSTHPTRRRSVLPPGDDAAVYCPRCGYDLRARTSQTCPECGLRIDAFAGSVIPWMERRRIGRLAALARTLALVLWDAERVCCEVVRPVRERDTVGFQAVVVLWGWGWTLIVAAVAEFSRPGLLDTFSLGFGTSILVAVAVGWGMFLWFACSAVTIFFEALPPRQEHGRCCMALARLTCAPLTLLPLPLVMLAMAIVASMRSRLGVPGPVMAGVFIMGLTLGASVPALVLKRAVTFHRRLVRRTGALLLMCCVLPLIWLLLAVICLVLLPGLFLLTKLALASLR